MGHGMDKREYLRSLGFTVGERGRFTAEMMTALKEYEGQGGKLEARSGKRDDGLPEIEPVSIIPDIPPQKPVRKPKQLYGYTTEGYKVGFITCRRCANHMMYCECKDGILAPSIVSMCDDPLVNVGA